MSSDFSKLTALVTTSSPKATARLLRSLDRYCVGLKSLVATNEQVEGDSATAVGVPDPRDVNTSRNALLARVRTPYVLLLDDSIELSKKSQVGKMLDSTATAKFDLLAGELLRCTKSWVLFTKREADPSHGIIQTQMTATGEQVEFQPKELTGKTALPCDFTQSFFVARTDKLRALGGWTSASPFDEREEFFLRAKRFGLQVGLLPTSTASCWVSDRRSNEDQKVSKLAALAELGVSHVVDCEGRKLELASTPLSQAA